MMCDVSAYCVTYAKNAKKGNISKLLLYKMPLIDISFKQVAVDIVGPIHTPSGLRYKVSRGRGLEKLIHRRRG